MREFDQVRYPVAGGSVARLLNEQAGDGAGPATDALREQLGDLVARHIDGRPGFFVLTGLDPANEAAARRFAVAASAMVGELLPQDDLGTVLRDVRDRGMRLGEGRTGRYSDSRQGGSLHTDGPHMAFPAPECFALLCVRQSLVGGELVLVHITDLVNRLPRSAVDTLRQPFYFDRRQAAGAATVIHPVLGASPSGPTVRYLREYIELGHAHPSVPDLTPQQVAALDALDALLDDPRSHVTGKLTPGEMVFVNNLVICHGRTAFTDPPGDQRRLMLRTWIRRGAPGASLNSQTDRSPAREARLGPPRQLR